MNETKIKYRAKCNRITLEFYLHEEDLFNWVKKHLTPKQIKFMLASIKEKYEAHEPTQEEREAIFEGK